MVTRTIAHMSPTPHHRNEAMAPHTSIPFIKVAAIQYTPTFPAPSLSTVLDLQYTLRLTVSFSIHEQRRTFSIHREILI